MVAGREMRLVHWSKQPIAAVESREQSYGHRMDKPRGLWVSDESAENSWSSWCEDEHFGGTDHPHVYEVALRPDDNVLIIDSELELIRFDERYSKEPEEYEWLRGHCIDWPKVAEEYHGIIISPYQWGQRLGPLAWYYSWDCASGCIWNGDSVRSLIALAAVGALPTPQEDG